MTAPATAERPAAEGPATGVPGAGQVAGRRWRSARGILAVVLLVIVVAVALAALRPSVQPRYLDPDSPTQGGARALAQILRQRGVSVDVARSAPRAAALTRPGSLLVITRPERLSRTDLEALAVIRGDLLIIEPSPAVLDMLLPQVDLATSTVDPVADPGCRLDAAARAGRVEFGPAETFTTPAGAIACYPDDDRLPRLVQLFTGSRTVTVVGSGDPFTNANLADEGNAALGLNLFGARSAAIWLIPDRPDPEDVPQADSWEDLIPLNTWLLLLQLLIAVVLTALWRMRRMGPVVAEALPVVVRSAETVEGRARLYRAHRARGQAAEALRAGSRERLARLLGLPAGAAQDPAQAHEIVSAIAQRTHWAEPDIGAALYGPDPGDDAQLVALTDALDDLERQVRES